MDLFRIKSVQTLFIFITLINITPGFGSATKFFVLDELGLNEIFLSNVGSFGLCCYVIGMVAYSYYFIKF